MNQIATPMPCTLISAPVEDGAGQPGCALGPSALLAAGLAQRLRAQGHRVMEFATQPPGPLAASVHRNAAVVRLPEMAAWTVALAEIAYQASGTTCPVFLGGDHSLSAGTMAGLARRAAELGRPLFVLWLDAHPDFHTLDTTQSGNLHGVPLAYAAGRPGFDGYLPALACPVDPARICLLGVRSTDDAEAAALADAGIDVHPPRGPDADLARALASFLDRVQAADGLLHVSLDADFIDPADAPGVGTPVAGGATATEAFCLMGMLARSRLVSSVDLVELNPVLDEHRRTTWLMVELAARLLEPAAAGTTAIAA